MNELKLSKRLEKVAHAVPKGVRLADIGSDHAYLPIYCYLNGIISSAVAGEVVEGPYQTAKNQVSRLGLDSSILVRMGNGLEVIQPGEIDTITICGMGGSLITSILDEGVEKLRGVSRLILQPNISAVSIRKWLLQNGWCIIQEYILEEDEKIYEVLVAEVGNPMRPYDEDELNKQLLLGPLLLKEKNPVFIKKWNLEKENWVRILNQLDVASVTKEIHLKQEELNLYIKYIEEALK
ncbi:tRNA (adenine(22)-N(1))-methyltransferase [Bacillus sp. DJP31]|uniref:tRNA (adenine(22)-N(1))-methyltransferase n=1 Tax=Bacillus sp. DJP31 TaxID=3409789 RepID=UPI003BB7BC9E